MHLNHGVRKRDRKTQAQVFSLRRHFEAGWCWGLGSGWMIGLRANRCATNVFACQAATPWLEPNSTALHRSGQRNQREEEEEDEGCLYKKTEHWEV